ncbi:MULTISPECIES: HIT family protein [unclassified Undibacterium]|uniref:HIT family protein n=1 Tax=unclassified Undibacterium TaxID=2630295 RepID=UPI002AC9B803|nr:MULTISPECIES: HIT family protein [unclassified Undibacterium]MEB0140672.1 HIT family protein [Undibacterium sp. CCC2.1]MEB0173868.1 HIT family protein [Undibacterium sp. CCC1.1]MEB0177703.1 HIT family protein [Undibacterium sp. CCC3.4]MEB0216851.1 HIT family protein [Undibacterium sp. 5I2]WPX44315.1 HIT family protein [Undibacterium sp. CCC3.4]
MSAHCELCALDGGDVIVAAEKWRVILVDDANYPGFCRVIWHAHVKEMSELSEPDRQLLMAVVWQVETVLRRVMQPDKINLASFGNMVPHLHWHVIPRFIDDAHFPQPVWAAPHGSSPDALALAARRAVLPQLRSELIVALNLALPTLIE